MPSDEQMPGIQSTNLTCTSDPLRELCENAAASMRKKNPSENCYSFQWCQRSISLSAHLLLPRMYVQSSSTSRGGAVITKAPEMYTPELRTALLFSHSGLEKRKRRLFETSILSYRCCV